jgi:hypothetical protein
MAFNLTDTDLRTLAPPSPVKSPLLGLAVGPVIERVGGLSLNIGNGFPFDIFRDNPLPSPTEREPGMDGTRSVSLGIGGRGGRGHTGRLMTIDGVRRNARLCPGEGGGFVWEGVTVECDGVAAEDTLTGD